MRSFPKTLSVLSPREVKICRLLIDGRKNKEIAWELNLKEQTIKNYTHKIYKKLGAAGRVSHSFKCAFSKNVSIFFAALLQSACFIIPLLSLPPFEKSNFCLLCRK